MARRRKDGPRQTVSDHNSSLSTSCSGGLKMKEFADDNLKFDENGKFPKKGIKHCGKRRNCFLQLVTSNFSFSHSVFKRLVQETHENKGLFGKVLNKWILFGWLVSWLVVLGLHATLTAIVISWQSLTHMCFLAFSHQY